MAGAKVPMEFNPTEIEARWRQRWEDDRLYEVSEQDSRPKYYALTMFPYTSGDLHIGHWYAMAPSDVHARFKRMQGYNVLHPMGFDAFGLPAENAAIARGIHPRTWTMNNVERMRRQLKTIGAIYDWKREVITCLPEYYKWTQWFFLKLYHGGLAYQAEAPVNWCPKCQTVLANEQVVDGGCERCGTGVVRKSLKQWFFRITKYADELLDHSQIDWPERIATMQKNWIGKSRGLEISFHLEKPLPDVKEIPIFTTRPDTIYGVTFLLLAPEHPLVPRLTTPAQKAEVEEYVARTRRQSEFQRTMLDREKTGAFLGSYAINHLNGERVPFWVADFVLPGYGTGAVMAVPAHDQRDFEFAVKFKLPIRVVISPPGWQGEDLKAAYVDPGIMVNSVQFCGLASDQGIEAVSDFIEEHGWGRRKVTYRIRDWLISRQRYWGAPIPIVHCPACGVVPVPEKDLPVLLPEEAEFRPTGESPLKYCEPFVNTVCPRCGGQAQRETDTMDTFMCSSWYFLRYASPDEKDHPFDPARLAYWMPVDLYTGGAEHANMHLLYARFFTKAIRDLGIIKYSEPFTRLFNQGTIISHGEKMSKSRGNVVTPDDYVSVYGADAVRAYLMFVGPWEQGGEWQDNGLVGVVRWLNRVWKLVTSDYVAGQAGAAEDRECLHQLHRTISRVTDDLGRLQFNTMVASLMELTNYLMRQQEARTVSAGTWRQAISNLLLLMAPSVPYLAEELWARTGHEYSIHNQHWPSVDTELARREQVTLVVEVNGKVRDKASVAPDIAEEAARELALASSKVRPFLQGKKIARVIYVPGKLVNIVTGS